MVSPPVPPPSSAPSLAELRGGLGNDEHLAGYDVIIDALSETLTGRRTLLCVRGSRREGDRFVPTVLAILDDSIHEVWLNGRQVHAGWTPRPGPRW